MICTDVMTGLYDYKMLDLNFRTSFIIPSALFDRLFHSWLRRSCFFLLTNIHDQLSHSFLLLSLSRSKLNPIQHVIGD